MRRTILASLVSGLLAGLVGALIVVLVIDDDDSAAPDSPLPAALAQTQAAAGASPQAASGATGESVDSSADAATDDTAAVVERVSRSVVLITVELADQIDDQGRTIARGGIGTGVILDAEGHVLTNEHVVSGATRIELQLFDGSTRVAQIVGGDAPFTDLAVLRTDPAGLTPAAFSPSAALRFGDRVLAFGNALGNDAALTVGVVSNPAGSFFDPESGRQDYIQTDAGVSPGMSGGPLFTGDGNIVGLVTRVVTSTGDGQTVQGVGFALPTDRILAVAERIISAGTDFPRPDFGVVDERTLSDFVAGQIGVDRTEGTFLVEISRVGGLAQAGLRPGDIILSLNGFPLTSDSPYLNVLQELEPGQPVDVVYVDQEGDEHSVEVIPVLRTR